MLGVSGWVCVIGGVWYCKCIFPLGGHCEGSGAFNIEITITI